MLKRVPRIGLAVWPALACSLALGAADGPPKFELKDGDRVVLLGGTFIEREQADGYLETALTSRYPDRNVTFRNLGWSGDTVFGIARARFGNQAEGFKHLKDHVEALKPTVILVSYGQNESFAGEAGLPDFRKGLDDLLKALDKTGARIVFVSPIRQEDLGRPLPDPAKHNSDLYLYIDALKKVAADRGYPFVNLFEKLESPAPLTDNGIHLTPTGYRRAAETVAAELGLSESTPALTLDADGKVVSAHRAKAESVEAGPGRIAFKATLDALPPPPPAKGSPGGVARPTEAFTVLIRGLPGGRYRLKVDGKESTTVRGATGQLLVPFVKGPDAVQAEKLRETINAKNELYFHRWRPQNETYLFGFRKHEQGQNAREIPMFDPLVAAKEAEIAKLRKPQPHTYEITRIEEATR